jgi:hypothetical protein
MDLLTGFLNTSPVYLLWGIFAWTLLVIGLIVARKTTKQKYLHALGDPTPDTANPPDLLGIFDQPSEHDLLGFSAVSKAIAGLLRNKATQAPYSIVLSGGWGVGKSSVMAQVRREMMQKGKRMHWLWFNVWHFQNGQHLLSSFLGSILARCEEKSNALFHFKLLWRRFLNQGFWSGLKTTFSVFLLLPLGLYLIYSLLHIQPLKPLARSIDSGISSISEKVDLNSGIISLFTAPFRLLNKSPELIKTTYLSQPPGKSTPSETVETVGKPEAALWTTLLAWGGTLLAFRKELFSKESIITNLVPMEQFKLEAASSDPGFRSKYQQEFREVMRAAPAGSSFVVFIDDVDRIAGERVLELLESINFISDTAGQVDAGSPNAVKFFFIIGMNVPEVVRTLSHVLNPDGKLTEDEAHKKAADYLAKLVDMVVPMPDLQHCSKEQLSNLLFGADPGERPEN